MSKELQKIKDERNRRRADGTFGNEQVDYDELRKNMSLWDKICNFLYCYKYYIIVIGFFVIASIYTLVTTVFAPKPDYTILVFTKQKAESVYGAVLAEELEAYADDVNGDGEVIVEVYDCAADEDNDNLIGVSSKVSEFLAEIEVGDKIIYLLDDERYDYLANYFKEINNGEGFAVIRDGKDRIDISDSELIKNSESGFDNLYYCIRDTGENTRFSDEEDIAAQVEAAKKLLSNIEVGKKNNINQVKDNK